jgi:hypothetical protein
MSEHFVKQGEPPPGLTSFTKIRLGWITKEEVRFVRPGSEAIAWLAPLAKGGETLAVKIPLNDGTYYLIENRQPFGYDKSLTDAGILVLKVSPNAEEGYGTVEIVDANPGARHFTRAAYKLKEGAGGLFLDKKNGVAVVPLWKETGQHGVLVTTPEKGSEALLAALSIDSLAGREDPGKAAVLKEARAAFKRFEFGRALEIVRKAAGS